MGKLGCREHMSELQQRLDERARNGDQAILLPLISGERTPGTLTAPEAFLVARWAVKTFFALSAAIQEKRVPIRQYRELTYRTTRLPSGIHVFATQRKGLSAPAGYTVDATWRMSRKISNAEDYELVTKTSYKASLQVGELFLLVVWWPLGAEWVLGAQENEYQLLFPQGAPLIIMPPPNPFPPEIVAAVGEETIAQLDTDAPIVGVGLTLSFTIFHRADLPVEVLAEFNVPPL
jgi:hypothetical protein